MPKRKKAVSSSSESSDDESSTASDTGSVSSQGRDISGDKSNSDDEVPDVKDQFLCKAFQPKPYKVAVSKFARDRLRGPFLGTPMGKEERTGIVDDYYCSDADYALFSAHRVSESPLSLLVSGKSDAFNDLTKIHQDLLLAVRIGLIPYEAILALAANWAKEKITATGILYPAGIWRNLNYRYRSSFAVPIPYSLRRDITGDEMEEFLNRDFVANAAGERSEKLDVAVRYGLSYKKAFEQLRDMAEGAHIDAITLEDAVVKVQEEVSHLVKDTGSSLRVIGGVCQQVKSMREAQYIKPLDEDFRKFLSANRKSQTPKQKMEARAGHLVDADVAGQAKKYGKLRKAMESVSKDKKEKIRKALASKRAATAAKADRKPRRDGAGPSKAPADKDRKSKKKAKGGAGGKFRIPKKAKPKQDKSKDE